jgi:hypothetical protein
MIVASPPRASKQSMTLVFTGQINGGAGVHVCPEAHRGVRD